MKFEKLLLLCQEDCVGSLLPLIGFIYTDFLTFSFFNFYSCVSHPQQQIHKQANQQVVRVWSILFKHHHEIHNC